MMHESEFHAQLSLAFLGMTALAAPSASMAEDVPKDALSSRMARSESEAKETSRKTYFEIDNSCSTINAIVALVPAGGEAQ